MKAAPAHPGPVQGPAARRQRGLSMVELMVALLISTILLGGVITLFISSKKGYAIQDAAGRLQENARFASSILGLNLRMTDYWGGVGPSTNVSLSPKVSALQATGGCYTYLADSASGINSGIIGYAGVSSLSGSSLPSALVSCIDPSGKGTNYVPNTEILVLRYADPEPADFVSDTNVAGSAVDPTTGVAASSSLYVRYETGFSAWIFQGSEVGSAPTNLAQSGTDPVFNTPYEIQIFFIRACSNMANGSYCQKSDDGGNPQPSLGRITLLGNVMQQQTLVDGVEYFRCLYGLDTSNSNNVTQFATAGSVSNWQFVFNVRYSIVVRGDAPNLNQPDAGPSILGYPLADGSYYLPSSVTLPLDNVKDQFYQRRVYSESVQIRNRARY